MGKCVNEKCNNDPSGSLNCVIVSPDGDMACCPECAKEFQKQMDHFCEYVLSSPERLEQWLMGDEV